MKTRAGEAQKRNYAFDCLVKWDGFPVVNKGSDPGRDW